MSDTNNTNKPVEQHRNQEKHRENKRLLARYFAAREVVRRLESSAHTPEEEQRLDKARAKEASCLEDVVQANMGFVKYMAFQYTEKHDPLYEDLVAAGASGLMEAVRTFDPSRGNTLTTYAQWLIRTQMQRVLSEEYARWHQLSRGNENMRALKAAREELEQRNGTSPSMKEIAEYLNWPIEKVHTYAQRCQQVMSLDCPHETEEGLDAPLGDELEDVSLRQQLESVNHQDAVQRAVECVVALAGECFDEQELDMLRIVAELAAADSFSNKAAAKRLGVSEGRASQIRTSMRKKLRQRVDESGFRDIGIDIGL